LKEEGSRAFAMKDYAKANAAWDKALGTDGISDSDVALIHNNKAACFMVKKQYKEAVEQCSVALKSQPEYVKALVRRAKAYENLGSYKDALRDIQKAVSLGNEDAKTTEQRLKALVAGKKPAGMGSKGLGSNKRSVVSASGGNKQLSIPVKLTLESDTRSFHLSPGVTYSELLEHAKQLFPSAGPFVLKVLDKEGDLITIASRADIHRAIQESIEAAGNTIKAQQGHIPPVRLHAMKVASDQDVPKAPEEESKNLKQMLEQFQKLQTQSKKPSTQQQAEPQQIQVDEWILAFVELLKEHCHLDPDRPIEAQEIGNERLNSAFQAMMQTDPKADELLDAAFDKFEEQAALGMVCQAQVYDAKATNIMQKAAASGDDASTINKAVEELFTKADKKIDEAIAYCPKVLDAYVMKSQLQQARAKLVANYLVETVKPSEAEDADARFEADEAASKAAVARAFDRVSKESATAAEKHMEEAFKLIEQAMDIMPAEEKERKLKKLKPMAEQVPGDPESETPLKATLIINLGNAHYEHSILRAAGGLDWKESIQKARKLFNEAGAADVDIRNALKGHPMAEQMKDLIGPDNPPKGLPSLKKKGKK
jgi:tetratricopeptide (TPR) repeat protein